MLKWLLPPSTGIWTLLDKNENKASLVCTLKDKQGLPHGLLRWAQHEAVRGRHTKLCSQVISTCILMALGEIPAPLLEVYLSRTLSTWRGSFYFAAPLNSCPKHRKQHALSGSHDANTVAVGPALQHQHPHPHVEPGSSFSPCHASTHQQTGKQSLL